MGKHVLVVDDDPIMLRLMRTYLQNEYKVSIVNSGRAALQFLDKFTPDVIILDYLMPEEDGAQTMRNIYAKEGCGNIPIIFVTGLEQADKLEECKALNPYGVLQKPVEQAKLLDILKDI